MFACFSGMNTRAADTSRRRHMSSKQMKIHRLAYTNIRAHKHLLEGESERDRERESAVIIKVINSSMNFMCAGYVHQRNVRANKNLRQ